MTALLEIRNLKVAFGKGTHKRVALNGVDLAIEPGKTLGVVGESGCGKSLTALSILQLLPRPGAHVEAGQILYRRPGEDAATDILKHAHNSRDMRRLRGKDIAMIFQEPMTALDPVYSIGHQICEMLREHEACTKQQAWARAVELLRLVGVPSPEERAGQYPHEFSGGMRQRAVIAIALACNPALLIADEPTTALDVTVQAQVLDLMRGLQRKFGTAILFITHDIGVISQMADDVVVMYLGEIIERGSMHDVIGHPAHPYTQGLIASVPTLEMPRGERIQPIDGMVPQIGSVTQGCRFRSRCPHAWAKCETDPPMTATAQDGHVAACWRLEADG